jgi:hypothetical protein
LSITPNLATTGTKTKGLWPAGFLALLVGFVIIFGLTWWKAYSNYNEGEKYFRDKNYAMAVLAFEQTILNHFPLSPYQERAVDSLLIIGDLAYKQKDIPLALQAYQSLLFAQNSLTIYRSDTVQDTQRVIEKLKAINPDWVAGPATPKLPNRFLGFFIGIFLICWILSVLGFLNKGIDKNGKIIRPAAFYFMGIFAFSFTFWLISLAKL